MTAIPFREIILNSTFGYSYCRIVPDDRGKPADYAFIDVNDAFLKMVGHTRNEIIDRRVTEIPGMSGTDGEQWIDIFGRVALGGGPLETEKYSIPLDAWFHLSITSPVPGYFCVLSFDTTEKNRCERKLAFSEELYRGYFEYAPDGIFVTDTAGRYLHANPSGLKMLGYSDAELKNLTIFDMIPETDREKAGISLRMLREKGLYNKKSMLLRKGGERIVILFDAVSIQNDRLIAFCKDISAHEKIERERERYFTSFQAMAQPSLFTTPEGIIQEINNGFSQIYGYTKEETIGKNPHILNPGKEVYHNLGYSEEEYDSLFRDLWSKIRNPAEGKWEGIVINRKKTGELVWVNLIINSMFDDSGNLSGIIGLPIDVTSSREMEDGHRILLYRTIAELAELRDDDTGNHMKRVGMLARMFSKALGMNDKFCADLELFAPLHDIGKVGILDSILLAPRKLTVEEFDIMKNHTILGHDIVHGKKGFEMAAAITRSHHERYDGNGYPDGLHGKEIPLAAHITAIVDVYDALRSRRPYKEPWTHEKSVAHILESAGTLFDPDLIEIFETIRGSFATVFNELKD